jgi:hypothetical protein
MRRREGGSARDDARAREELLERPPGDAAARSTVATTTRLADRAEETKKRRLRCDATSREVLRAVLSGFARAISVSHVAAHATARASRWRRRRLAPSRRSTSALDPRLERKMDRGGVARVVKVFINIIIITSSLHWFPYDRVRVVNAVP